MEVKQKTAAGIGLFGAISIVAGAMIGIGIFFKNGTVFTNNGGNAIGIVISWVLAFVIALSTAYAFSEIVTCKIKNRNLGLAGWSERFVGYKFGRFVKITHSTFYYSINLFVVSVFAGEALLNCFAMIPGNLGSFSMWQIMLIAMALTAVLFLLNYFSFNASAWFAKITTIVKFIPLLGIAIFGIICACLGWGNNLFTSDQYIVYNDATSEIAPLNFQSIIMSLPAILFAFDSFLIIGNAAHEVKNPERNVPLSVVLSMIISAGIYLLVTVGQLCNGQGNCYSVFQSALDGELGRILSIVISVFLLIAILGCLNSFTIASVRSMQAAFETNVIIGSQKMMKLGNGKKLLPGFIGMWIIYLFLWISLAIPSIMMNNDQIVDGISNLVVLFYFVIYGTVALFGAINHKTKKVEVKKTKMMVPFAIIGALGCYLAVGYCICYQYTFEAAFNATNSYTAWGLFLDISGRELTYWQAAIVFWSCALVFFAIPFINDGLIKITNKNYNQALIWEKQINNNIGL